MAPLALSSTMMVIHSFVPVFLFAVLVSARSVIRHSWQTVIAIAETGGAGSSEPPTAVPTLAPRVEVFRRQMEMSLSNSMSAETMTMIESSQTVVELISMDSTGSMVTQILSTVTPTSMLDMSSGSHRRNVGAIVGGTVGGVVAVALVVAALLFWRRRRKGEERHESNGDVFAVVPSKFKPSLDVTHPATDYVPNTVPTPFGTNNWQAMHHVTQSSGDPATCTSPEGNQRPILSGKQELARQQRQRDLELQMRQLQDEMAALGPVPGPSVSLPQNRAEDARQMELMRQQIAMLQAQQHSSWAQGLTDEPPPDYTANAAVSRTVGPER